MRGVPHVQLPVGQRYGHWTILRYVGRVTAPGGFQPSHYYECKCDCGTVRNVKVSTYVLEHHLVVVAAGVLMFRVGSAVNKPGWVSRIEGVGFIAHSSVWEPIDVVRP